MRRFDSWRLREQLREHPSAPPRQQICGQWRYATNVELQKLPDRDGAWWLGVIQCRARMCPVCWTARRWRVGAEVAWTVEAREASTKQQSYLITLTIRHSLADPVEIVRELRKVWRAFIQARAWQKWKREHGAEYISALEVTRGSNGWHPHLHVLVMPSRKPIDPEDTTRLSGLFFERWAAVVERKMGAQHKPQREANRCAHCDHPRDWSLHKDDPCAGCGRPYKGRSIGVDLRPCNAHGYLTKIGFELADPAAVKGREVKREHVQGVGEVVTYEVPAAGHKVRSINDVAQRGAMTGRAPLALLEAGEVDLYMELMHTQATCRDITYSRGLRSYRDEMPEAEAAQTLLALCGSDWGRLRHKGWEQPLQVAEAAKDEATARAAVVERLGNVAEPIDDGDHRRWE